MPIPSPVITRTASAARPGRLSNVMANTSDMLAEMPAARNTSYARVGSEQIIR